MIRNQFEGFKNEFNLEELTQRISDESTGSSRPGFYSSTFGSSTALTGSGSPEFSEVTSSDTGGVGQIGRGGFQAVIPTSLSSSFFVDQARVQGGSNGWVEVPTPSTPSAPVQGEFNRETVSGSATGELTHLNTLSEMLGGLSSSQFEFLRSMQFSQRSDASVLYSDEYTAGGYYHDGAEGGVHDDHDHDHGFGSPDHGLPSALGNGGDDDDDNNNAPIVNALDKSLEIGTFIAARQMFTYLDYDGDPLTAIKVIDKGQAANTGYWFYNGSRLNANQWYEVPVANLDKLRFIAAEIEFNEAVGIMAYDGKFWSQADFARVITTPQNLQKPTAEGFDGTVLSGESVKFEDYIRANDPEDNLLKVRIIDRINNVNSGYFSVAGDVKTQGQWFEINVSQISDVDYYGAKNGQAEYLAFQVYDGKFWSNVANFKMTTIFNYYRPVVGVADVKLDQGQVIKVGSLLTFSDPDGNTAKRFRFYDTGSRADGGYFTVDGTVQAANQWFEVLARDMDTVRYHAANSADFEKFRVMAYDGRYWSDISTGAITVDVKPTADVPGTVVVRELENVLLSSVFSANGNGVGIETVYLYESPSRQGGFFGDPNGELIFNGEVLEVGKVHEFTWAEYQTVSYRGGDEDKGRHFDEIMVKYESRVASTAWHRAEFITEVIGGRSLISGASWSNTPNTPVTVTYSFVNQVPFYYADDAVERTEFSAIQLNEQQKTRIRQALQMYSDLANIDFVEVPDLAVGGQMRFGIADLTGGAQGWAYYPDPGAGSASLAGDVWFDITLVGDPFIDGSEGWLTVIHEIGHAVGLAHSFEGVALHPDTESHFYTQMSYNRTFQVAGKSSVDGPYGVGGTDFPYGIDSLMLYDIVELQRLYGARPDQNEGDDIYTWSANDAFRATLRDTGGFDTLNASAYSTDQDIDLRPGHFSTIGLQDDTLFLHYDTVIENAITGAGYDNVIGNNANNLISTGSGNDTLEGGAGIDFLFGGAHNDTYIWREGDGWDTIDEDRKAGRDIIEVYGFHDQSGDNLPYGTINDLAEDFTFRRLGRDLRIDFTVDRGAAVGGITVKDFAWGGSRVETLQFFGANGSPQSPKISLVSIFEQATDVATRFQVTEINSALGYVAAPV